MVIPPDWGAVSSKCCTRNIIWVNTQVFCLATRLKYQGQGKRKNISPLRRARVCFIGRHNLRTHAAHMLAHTQA